MKETIKSKNVYVKKTDEPLLKHFAFNGTSWFYELYTKHKLASNKTIKEKLDRLDGSFIEQKTIQSEEPKRKERIYYGLSLRGLHYLYKKELITEDQIPEIIKRNIIEAPPGDKKELDLILKRKGVFGVYGEIITAILYEIYPKHKQVIEIMLNRFPTILFRDDPLFPVFSYSTNIKSYPVFVFVHATAELINLIDENNDFNESEFIGIVGETAFQLIELFFKENARMGQQMRGKIDKILKKT